MERIFGVPGKLYQLAVWSSGMILAQGARGPRLNSQNSPCSCTACGAWSRIQVLLVLYKHRSCWVTQSIPAEVPWRLVFCCRSTGDRSQFARVVKGVDLRSTARKCAWARWVQLPGSVVQAEQALKAQHIEKVSLVTQNIPGEVVK